jgi:hypothetical protein
VSAKELMERLAAMFPDGYTGKAQLRPLQRRISSGTHPGIGLGFKLVSLMEQISSRPAGRTLEGRHP